MKRIILLMIDIKVLFLVLLVIMVLFLKRRA